jgi:hypothetical protein
MLRADAIDLIADAATKHTSTWRSLWPQAAFDVAGMRTDARPAAEKIRREALRALEIFPRPSRNTAPRTRKPRPKRRPRKR